MKEIIVKTQQDFDKIEDDFGGSIIIKDTKEWLCINKGFNKAILSVSDNATIESVSDNATIESVSDNATIKSVFDNATIKYVSGDATIESVFDNATIKYVSGDATIESVFDNATIKYVSGDATIESVSDNATIKYVSDNATIESVFDNATIESVSDNATIEYVFGDATIESVSDNATIESVSDNATIKYVSGDATILLMTGLASLVLLYGAKKIVAKGMNLIRQIGISKINIEMSESVTFVQVKETIKENSTLEMFKKLYPIEQKDKIITMYKAVHKKEDGTYFSDYRKDYIYSIGETKEEKCASNEEGSCASGLHIAHKNWAIIFGKNWEDMALLECEVHEDDIVVCGDTDGKLRCSKLKVVREVPRSEW